LPGREIPGRLLGEEEMTNDRLDIELKGLRATGLTKYEYEKGYNRTDPDGTQVATITPQAPENLIASASGTVVTLSWDRQENLTTPHGYVIEYSLDEDAWSLAGTTIDNTFIHQGTVSIVSGNPVDTVNFYRVKILTATGVEGPYSAIESVTCEPIKQLNLIGELAEMISNGDAASAITDTLEEYAASKGVPLTDAFGNWEDLSNASVTVDEGGEGETTKTLSYIMKNVVIADLILGSLIKGTHMESETVTTDLLAAYAVTAEKLAAYAIMVENLFARPATHIDGGAPGETESLTFDGDAYPWTGYDRQFIDDRGVYTNIPNSYIAIQSPVVFSQGVKFLGEENLSSKLYAELLASDAQSAAEVTAGSLASDAQSAAEVTAGSLSDEARLEAIIAARDNVAQKLGYTDYEDMVTEAAAGNTIISGGFVRTSLLDVDTILGGDAIFSGCLDAVDGEFTGTLNSVDGHFKGRLETSTIITAPGTGSNITRTVAQSANQARLLWEDLYCDGELEANTFYNVSSSNYTGLKYVWIGLGWTKYQNYNMFSQTCKYESWTKVIWRLELYDADKNLLVDGKTVTKKVNCGTSGYPAYPDYPDMSSRSALCSEVATWGTVYSADSIDFGQSITLTVEYGGDILKFVNLPTADPSISDHIWVDGDGYIRMSI
jgi:hypothetical protein